MSFAFQDNLLGAADPYTVDNVGSGAFSLVGASAGKMVPNGFPRSGKFA